MTDARQASPWAGAIAAAIVWLLADATLLACPICFRFEESAATDGAIAAVVVLVSVTVAVLGACAAFVVRFARREAADCPTDPTRKVPDSRSQMP